ncbi:MAG: FG-GAP-like repeat-containing protein [Kiritimatiellae bacterium]|nr:FG-GAP-like repeat-containing protein [Kiritimatiellia bacterium]
MRSQTTIKKFVLALCVLSALCFQGCLRVTETRKAAGQARALFTDVTAEAGLRYWGCGKCVVFGDVNNDGFLDMFYSVCYGPNRLFLNEGNGTFRDISDRLKTDAPYQAYDSHGAAFVHLDDNDFVDLVVSCNASHSLDAQDWYKTGFFKEWPDNHLYYNNGQGFLVDLGRQRGFAKVGPGEQNLASAVAVGDFDNDGDLDLFVSSGDWKPGPFKFFRNDGGEKFTEASQEIGLQYSGSGFASQFVDFDNDGWPDLYVSHFNFKKEGEKDKVARHLLRNNRNGAFTDVTKEAGISQKGRDISVAFGDINNDGYSDLYIASFEEGIPTDPTNRLYLNNGNGTFTDITAKAGVGCPPGDRGCLLEDVDNDGYVDLLVVGSRTYLLKNNGDCTFADVTRDSGLADVVGGHGIALGDLDNDGDLDLYITNWAWGPAGAFRLFRNNQDGGNSITVRLRGDSKWNRSAVGAKIYVYEAGHCGDRERLLGFREVQAGTGYLTSKTIQQHFGLGRHSVCDIEVVFPASSRKERRLSVPRGIIGISATSGLREVDVEDKVAPGAGVVRPYRISVDSTGVGTPASLCDGNRGGEGWQSEGQPFPHYVELSFRAPELVRSVAIHWGASKGIPSTSKSYAVQYWDGNDYRDIVRVKDRLEEPCSVHSFPPVRTEKLRISQSPVGGHPGNMSVMWISEIEVVSER